ncbi:MAG TPA: sugar ABC transporter ATP-binding protein [Solirubrobacterales bacterium]|nr:sugar ABC transporter ATP-binding protein [Solirubrobacterales bacterium]
MLAIRGLSKTFTGQMALDHVDFDLRPGEVHALVGQNGSGKSTLIKVLAGYHQPDRGASALVAGAPLDLGNSTAAADAGLRFVHQDLGLAPTLSALDNLALGRGYHRGKLGTISWRREARAGRQTLAELGFDFNPKTPIYRLTASQRTGVAIARALEDWSDKVRVLVLDEPTASLPAAEVRRLFEVIRRVRDRGVAIVYVSHRFAEVFEIADRITVLRDGERVATMAAAELTERSLTELTIGRELDALAPVHPHEPQTDEGTVFSVRGLRGEVLESLDLDIGAGEIVGIAGVTGSGREEVTELVCGGRSREGEVRLEGRVIPAERPDVCFRSGMAFVPADRLSKAALPSMRIRENLTICNLDPAYGPLGLSKSRERAEVRAWLDKLDVVPRRSEAQLLELSGGNQQKVMMARAMRLNPKLLVLDEPTQGVDVGAKASIHRIVRDAVEAGAAALVASTESEELLALCDRIVVLVDGKPCATYRYGDLSADELTQVTMGSGDLEERTKPSG